MAVDTYHPGKINNQYLEFLTALPLAACFPFDAPYLKGLPTMRYELDATWPKELPEGWILGQLSGVCVDAEDRVYVMNRCDITEEEAEIGVSAPPVLVFDAEGNLIDSWGDIDRLPIKPERIVADHEGNLWIPGQQDGLAQKYDRNGNLLLEIGRRGQYDTTDGTLRGAGLNAGTVDLFQPAGIAVDPETGDVFIADGYGNRRVAVFDRNGKFLRQWGRQATLEEAEAGVGGVFLEVVHAVDISSDGLVYVCDRQGDRIQAFDRQGNFSHNIWVRTGTAELPDPRGSVWTLAFSPDVAQAHIFLMNGRNEQVHVIERQSGRIVHTFGRPGHQAGAFTHGHTIAVDSKGRVYVSETHTGRRVQRFVPVA